MQYTINPHALTIRIGKNTFERHGKYFDDTDDHKTFVELCEKLNSMINYLFNNKVYIHFDLREAESCNQGAITIYPPTQNSKKIVETLANHFTEITENDLKFRKTSEGYFYCDEICGNIFFKDQIFDLMIQYHS